MAEEKRPINFEEKQKEVEEAYKEASEKAAAFNQALIRLRSIKMMKTEDPDEITKSFEIMKDLDTRTAYLLRMLLIQHGNVLFL